MNGIGLAAVAALAIAVLQLPPAATARAAAAPNDFDGDGYADLAVGVPGESVGTAGRDAGAVNVLYGSSSGLTAAGNQLWHQDRPGVKGHSEGRLSSSSRIGDRFGSSLASGDFDRDGFADLAIGAPGEDLRRGSVNVLYGTRDGLISGGDQRWDQGNLPGRPERDDVLGFSLAARDFDGDGYWDLAIGVPGDDVGIAGNEGSVEVIYGGPDGLSGARATVLKRTMTGAPDESVGFGEALAAGDLDGDGYGDLAVGAPEMTCRGPSCPFGGDVSVFYGSSLGLVTSGSQRWSQDSPGIEDATEPEDRFGWSLAIGDFDADGHDDLAIGAPEESVVPGSGAWCQGAVSVLYGSGTGLTAARNQVWSAATPGVPGDIESSASEAYFGWAIRAGDFDGDGAADLAIALPFQDVGADGAEGAVAVLRGGPGGLSATAAQLWSQDSPGIPGVAGAYDWFGDGLASADYGRSGHDDLAIGARQEDVRGIDSAGAVSVLYGSATGLTASGSQRWTQATSGVRDAPEKGDVFGAALGGSPSILSRR